ncbi:hypothetical protein SAMN05444166_7563 [Singulisphaera sp. GP187]|nr:hypothetical protein SAMN05444166_7563 [Singulisphaera sp. GP187]
MKNNDPPWSLESVPKGESHRSFWIFSECHAVPDSEPMRECLGLGGTGSEYVTRQ